MNMHARPLALLIDGAGYVDTREKRGTGDKWQQPCVKNGAVFVAWGCVCGDFRSHKLTISKPRSPHIYAYQSHKHPKRDKLPVLLNLCVIQNR